MNIFSITRRIAIIILILTLITACSSVTGSNLPAVNPTTSQQQAQSTSSQQRLQPTTQTTGKPGSKLDTISAPQNTQAPAATATHAATSTPNATPTSEPASATPTGANTSTASGTTGGANIKTVFIILMENHNWSDILNSPSAPYINDTLLPQASYAQQYFNPPGNHPSLPNYLWLEAGKSFGITSDGTPDSNHQSTNEHLVTLLDKAGVTWKSYIEGINGKECPLKGSGLFTPRHNPMLFFDNVTGNNDPNSAYCIAHERPFSELQSDLQKNTVASYNFITPNECDNMHSAENCPSQDQVKNGDTWLSKQVPMIMQSDAYKQGGVIFVVWDESEQGDNPIGMIVVSPYAKGGGYSNSIHYTHSSTLRTIEEIFHITPLLGDAAKATDLSDLFKQFP